LQNLIFGTHKVYNGDIGYIDDVDPNAGEIVASFDGRSVTYGFGELDMLVPAYAVTIHKSQGSEYPVVVIPVVTQHYTAATWLMQIGVSTWDAAAFLGMSEKTLRDVYGHHHPDYLQAAAKAIGAKNPVSLVIPLVKQHQRRALSSQHTVQPLQEHVA
jgi:hypothetical protein